MPVVPLPINGPAYKNIDPVSLSNMSEALIDGYVNEAENTVKRPGLEEFADVNTVHGIDGVYWWENKSIFITISGGNVYKITQTGIVTDITGDSLVVGTRVSFATDGTYLIMVNGGRMIYTDGTANTAFIADADAPIAVTHVAFIDGYILANVGGTGRFQWSNLNDALTWDALDFATAEGAPDNLVAIHTGWREIMLFGSESIETWYNDGTTPFIRYGQGYSEGGCAAPYTVRLVDNNWFYMDYKRHIVVLEGRTPKILSTPFDKVIQGLDIVSDATADVIRIEGTAFYVIHFPTENLTLAYNYKDNNWQQWGFWNTITAEYDRWLGNCHEYVSNWNLHLVGSKNTSKIYKMSSAYLDDDGEDIRLLRRTGYVDHGTSARKRSREIRLRLKKGHGKTDNLDPNDSNSIPYFTLKWRDDGNSNWGKERMFSLQRVGDTDFIARITGLGMYRTRQYEIAMSDKTPFVLVSGEEELEILS